MKESGKGNPKISLIPAGRIAAFARKAGRLAEKQRKTGYH